jgi:hypothetical protein
MPRRGHEARPMNSLSRLLIYWLGISVLVDDGFVWLRDTDGIRYTEYNFEIWCFGEKRDEKEKFLFTS